MSSTPQDQYLAVCKELERLNHDIARHVQIAAEQAQEIEWLRSERDGWRDAYEDAKRDAAAARALLREVREWIPYYRWIPDLRERVDAIIGKKTP